MGSGVVVIGPPFPIGLGLTVGRGKRLVGVFLMMQPSVWQFGSG